MQIKQNMILSNATGANATGSKATGLKLAEPRAALNQAIWSQSATIRGIRVPKPMGKRLIRAPAGAT
tara:strand:- start:15 stop:215 length:201 start_codon:yes stop_codon:yes gene_type:complete